MASMIKPDYLFEVSWEVCNKVGGIYTVVSTKATQLIERFGENYYAIGPDVISDDINNPDFIENDGPLYEWKQNAIRDGLRIKIGKWNIPGSPNVILVDFSPLINQKDDIFSRLWESYKLDSIAGQWDYIEPALFGYAAGKVIESFVKHNLSGTQKVVAQFHEWMTGAGILYLKQAVPQVATVFTTHATVVGRCLAGNNRPLYREINKFNLDEVTKQYNIVPKYSLERNAALHCDAFTTVSEITANECSVLLQKEVDLVTPNGFDDTFLPKEDQFYEKRSIARKRFFETAEALLGSKISDDSLLMATSGRYEFKNKGIDLLIDSLGVLNKSNQLTRDVVVFLLIPANHYGPRKDLLRKIHEGTDEKLEFRYMTHNLHDIEYDPIISRIKSAGLNNNPEDRVKIIFVPSYLNGDDGIFRLKYYDLLIGLDLTVFASYYEPWGYTPLESLAFKVPTVTTTLAGFGVWVNEHFKNPGNAINIIHRTDDNDLEVVKEISRTIIDFSKISKDEYLKSRENAFAISQIAIWENLVDNYLQAFSVALEKVEQRAGYYQKETEPQMSMMHDLQAPKVNYPNWKRLTVHYSLPDKLSNLKELMKNLWWTWDVEAQELFESIHPQVWHECDNNPITLFERVDYKRLKALENDPAFVGKLDHVYRRFTEYMAVKPEPAPKIAYFSMEYGMHDSVKIFSGGLGILAGDYLKEASDRNKNLVAIGILYRYGYFKQMISLEGDQIVNYEAQHFSKMPIHPIRDENGNFRTISLALPGRILYARLWKVLVGRIELILLDTDFDDNLEHDRYISHHLYGGDNENRLKQELLLGIGGIRALEALRIDPDLYHSNEGHSAFIGLERMRKFIQHEKLSFNEALEIVRSTTLFTTHTPVPAGHDSFPEDLLRTYISHYPGRLKISWDEFMALGRANPNNWEEKFNMSHLAAHLSQEVNGVSWLHGKVSRDMFSVMWPGYLPEELHVGYVTNGVHLPTWMSKDWMKVFREYFGESFENDPGNRKYWEKVAEIPDDVIWNTKQKLRTKLMQFIKERYRDSWLKRTENPRYIVNILENLDDKTLTIGFARRFATYKRAHLLFNNLEALEELVNNPDRPVQFIFAGKAHPHDKAGQDLIKHIVEISKRPQFAGKILFLQNYDMELAKHLVQGVDIWLNTPTRPLEASGTSGEKAIMNGTLHFSVLDGWWVEGYKPNAGFALPMERTYTNQDFQDKLDAETIYNIIDNEILPAFYTRTKEGVPTQWVKFIKNSYEQIVPEFTTTRMINDYYDRYYNRLYQRSSEIVKNDYALAKQLSYWKRNVSRKWDDIKVLNVSLFQQSSEPVQMGKEYNAEVTLDLAGFTPTELGVEMVLTEDFKSCVQCQDFVLTGTDGTAATYHTTVLPFKPGSFNMGIRLYPKHPSLPHRQDFGYVRWI